MENPCQCIPQQKWPHVVKNSPLASYEFFRFKKQKKRVPIPKWYERELFSVFWEIGQRVTCTGGKLPRSFRFFFVWEPLKGYLFPQRATPLYIDPLCDRCNDWIYE